MLCAYECVPVELPPRNPCLPKTEATHILSFSQHRQSDSNSERSKMILPSNISASVHSPEDTSGYPHSSKDEEKTIPFLRRLVDMLTENENVISFCPGSIDNDSGNVILGKIVVHDRLKVEANVLPRYFNHSSFASLRRQLNYFCFTRVGKGRQRGATYCNEAVINLQDILRLKRRSSTGGTHGNDNHKRQRDVSLSLHTTPSLDEETPDQTRPLKRMRPSIVSPRSSPLYSTRTSEPKIALDLTLPAASTLNQDLNLEYSTPPRRTLYSSPKGDAEILAGCRALLSISRGSSQVVW